MAAHPCAAWRLVDDVLVSREGQRYERCIDIGAGVHVFGLVGPATTASAPAFEHATMRGVLMLPSDVVMKLPEMRPATDDEMVAAIADLPDPIAADASAAAALAKTLCGVKSGRSGRAAGKAAALSKHAHRAPAAVKRRRPAAREETGDEDDDDEDNDDHDEEEEDDNDACDDEEEEEEEAAGDEDEDDDDGASCGDGDVISCADEEGASGRSSASGDDSDGSSDDEDADAAAPSLRKASCRVHALAPAKPHGSTSTTIASARHAPVTAGHAEAKVTKSHKTTAQRAAAASSRKSK